MAEYRKARKRIDVSVGESVRIVRELQELSQNQLASSLGSLVDDLGDRARSRQPRCRTRQGARTGLKVHPAVLVFPAWTSSASLRPDSSLA